MVKDRIIWIDVLKGIAIFLVVIAHSSSSDVGSFIQCFHMPLFFLLSGWLFSPKKVKTYAKKSFFRLLVPYFSFLFVCCLPELTANILCNNMTGGGKSLLIRLLYGGYYLQGAYAVFWFITVLWMSLNLFNLLIAKVVRPIWLAVLIIFAYLCYLTPRPLPWNIHIVPMATVYIWIGYLLKCQEDNIRNFCSNNKIATACSVFFVLVIIFTFREMLTFSMKYGESGIPLISLISSVGASICVALVAIGIAGDSIVAKIFSFFGLASMAIMYIHMPVKFYLTLRIAPPESYMIHISVGILLSIVAYLLMKKINFTRKYFLGERI